MKKELLSQIIEEIKILLIVKIVKNTVRGSMTKNLWVIKINTRKKPKINQSKAIKK